MKKANLFVIGCQKGGTTYIHDLLNQHPEIKMSDKKELHFFDQKSSNFDYLEYNKNFDFTCKYRGESTPSYMYIDEAIGRLYQYNSNAKLIVLLRNPITRAFSQYNMESSTRNLEFDFNYYLKNERSLSRRSLPYRDLVYSFLDRGFYSEQIRRIQRFFPDEQLLILKSEMFFSQSEIVFNNICDFLKIERIAIDVQNGDKHSRLYNKKITEEDRSFLRKKYDLDIKCLERLMNWDCSDWV